ncbi:MAG: glycosyltransferase [Acetatifactor sp.]|nr:glycosyltransferase [Acetatifactor sp.]
MKKIEFNDYQIIIVDNGSEDETPQIARRLCEKYPGVNYERINVRGVGAAFRRGVELSHGDIVGYMDIDLSTNLRHLGEAIHIFRTVDEVEYTNGSRFAKESDTRGRKWYRKITSQGLLILLKVFLGMKSTDAICGFTFMRRKVALSLVKGSSQDNGWFYMIELLLRAEKRGVRILDYPVEWQEDYNTTVKVFKTVCNYLVQIARLFKEFYIKKNI